MSTPTLSEQVKANATKAKVKQEQWREEQLAREKEQLRKCILETSQTRPIVWASDCPGIARDAWRDVAKELDVKVCVDNGDVPVIDLSKPFSMFYRHIDCLNKP